MGDQQHTASAPTWRSADTILHTHISASGLAQHKTKGTQKQTSKWELTSMVAHGLRSSHLQGDQDVEFWHVNMWARQGCMSLNSLQNMQRFRGALSWKGSWENCMFEETTGKAARDCKMIYQKVEPRPAPPGGVQPHCNLHAPPSMQSAPQGHFVTPRHTGFPEQKVASVDVNGY